MQTELIKKKSIFLIIKDDSLSYIFDKIRDFLDHKSTKSESDFYVHKASHKQKKV